MKTEDENLVLEFLKLSSSEFHDFLRKLDSREMSRTITLLRNWRTEQKTTDKIENTDSEEFNIQQANNNQFVMMFRKHFNSLSNEQKQLIRSAINGVD